MTDIDIHTIAAQIEARCTTLEAEIVALRTEKAAINESIKAKLAELELAASMRPRKRKVADTPAVQPLLDVVG